MKLIRKYLYWLLITAVFGCIILYCVHGTSDALPLKFRVTGPSAAEEITLFDAQDGNCYVFLPSYADPEQVTVVLTSDREVRLGDVLLTDGMSCRNFEPDTAYTLKIGGKQVSTVFFCRSANVATMYITTATGNMVRIHEDKDYRESAAMTLYLPDGSIAHTDMQATLKGRGNITWSYAKKSYVLDLSAEQGLLDLPASCRWLLLSNSMDETNLHNRLAYELAARAGKEWSPENAYVDVYLNGEYSGLYLLCEKLEPDAAHVNIDTAMGDFLCKNEHSQRWDSLRNPFTTRSGRAVEITAPEILTQEEKNRIVTLTDQLEMLLLSGADLSAENSIDLDSWVRRYLVDEICANIDADSNSAYFRYSGGVFYAGPFWDYDLTFGITRDLQPNAFMAYSNIPGIEKAPYYRALYENESFYRHMTEVYQSDFLPVLEEMLSGGIQELAATIEAASKCNRLRWSAMFEPVKGWNSTIDQTTDEFCAYLRSRVAFLNSAWIDGTDYRTLCFQSAPETYWTVAVKAGELPQVEDADFAHIQWYHADSGEPFDPSQPVTDDLRLVTAATSESGFGMRAIVVIASVAALLALLLTMAIADIRQRLKERGQPHGRTHTKIPS